MFLSKIRKKSGHLTRVLTEIFFGPVSKRNDVAFIDFVERCAIVLGSRDTGKVGVDSPIINTPL
jgi:hypothetical protein